MQLIDIFFAETSDKQGLKPIFDILASLGLPLFPTYLNVTKDFDYSTYKFDWLETVIKVKTHIGMDVIIGFDIFSDTRNSSVNTLAMGTPETINPFPRSVSSSWSLNTYIIKSINQISMYLLVNVLRNVGTSGTYVK